MAPRPTTSRVKELAVAAVKGASANPLARKLRSVQTAEERIATLQTQRDRLARERDSARKQAEALRRQNETLREQRDRGRAAGSAMTAIARALDLDESIGTRPLLNAIHQVRAESL